MSKKDETYIPALRYRWLTRFYDPIVALTTREQVFRKKLLGLITCTAGDRVLDLACGTGTLTRMIKSENPGITIHGLDGDPEILELARRKARQEKLDICFDEGMSFSMPYLDNAFDLVVSSLFFHHLTAKNKQLTLVEVHRVLSTNGRLLVCDWGNPANPVLSMTFFLVRILDGFEVTRENARGHLPRLIAEAGFSQVLVTDRVSTMLGTLDLITASALSSLKSLLVYRKTAPTGKALKLAFLAGPVHTVGPVAPQ